MEGYVHSVETFGLVDGPGVRYVIFLQGCHLRCRYCHNPETWSCGKGEIYRPEDLLAKAWRYRTYWMKKNAEGMNGGITLSGGEPLLQMEFATEFFRLAKGKVMPFEHSDGIIAHQYAVAVQPEDPLVPGIMIDKSTVSAEDNFTTEEGGYITYTHDALQPEEGNQVKWGVIKVTESAGSISNVELTEE